MGMQIKQLELLFIVGLLLSGYSFAFTIEDVNFDTSFGAQTRVFNEKPISPVQRRNEFLTLYLQQEISYRWNGGKDSWVFTPYLSATRYEDSWKIKHDGYVSFAAPVPIIDFGDTRTAHRIHGDIREFLWTHIADDSSWEMRTGIGRVFWGVTESAHLVDVINQDDLRTDIDEEDKLGQPMINLTLVKSYGNFDFFVLPGFREKAYQADIGRLNPVILANPYAPVSQTNKVTMVGEEDALYESSAEDLHTDFAFRWNHRFGINDISLSFFTGTNRDPVLYTPINEAHLQAGGAPLEITQSTVYPSLQYFTPYYEQMTQFGLDYQATIEGWLLKFEGIYRDSDSLKTPQKDLADGKTENFTTDYTAIAAGFEYTFYGVFNNTADLGVLIEYLWDSREFEATTPYQDDVFLGIRYAKNSVADPAILLGVIQDTNIDSYSVILEASRRIGNDSKIIFEALSVYNDGQAPLEITHGFDASTIFAKEDHVRLAWETYY